ncbi:MAG: hypothetical protein RL322_247 [Pseudomonadota bacterium]|jgi:hypothetical protein
MKLSRLIPISALSITLLMPMAAHASSEFLGALVGAGVGAAFGKALGGDRGAVVGGLLGAAAGASSSAQADVRVQGGYPYAPAPVVPVAPGVAYGYPAPVAPVESYGWLPPAPPVVYSAPVVIAPPVYYAPAPRVVITPPPVYVGPRYYSAPPRVHYHVPQGRPVYIERARSHPDYRRGADRHDGPRGDRPRHGAYVRG